MPARRGLTVYTAIMATLIGLFYVLPAARLAVTVSVGLASVAAVVAGTLVHRPHRRYSWWLVAAGLLASAAADTVYLLSTNPSAGASGSVSASASDILYLLIFPLFGGGMLGLTRSTVASRDRAGLLDFTIFGTAALFLLWILVIDPRLVAPGPATFERSALAAYALGGAILLVVTGRILVRAGRNPAAALLVVGAAGLFLSDLVYGAAVLEGSWHAGGLVELGWFACYASWGAAALHPSMAVLTEPAEPRRAEVSRVRVVLLGLAALVPPGVLLLQASTGTVRAGVIIAAVSGITFMLVLSRLSDAVDANRLAAARERTLRAAGAALVSATDVVTVERAVRVAVQQLLPRQAGRRIAAHRVVFAVHRAAGVPAAATSIWGPGLTASSTFHSGPTAAAARRTRMLRVATLRPPLSHQLREFPYALLCPLVLDERATGVPRVGALLVAAEADLLAGMRDPLEALATQAALALERVSLSQEISRRDSDEYFRSLVQHTSDVILIVNDDYRIRYASPSIAAVLGVTPAERDELRSVVHPDDRETFTALLDEVRDAPRREEWTEWRVRRVDGAAVDLEVSCRDLRQDRSVRGFVLTLRDVTERRRLERELGHRAAHDPLTGLANRASFQDQAYAAVEAARSAERVVGVLAIDIDEFTAINDTHGQAVGDEVLVAMGQRIRGLLAGTGLVARPGGDEFAVLLPDADDPEEIEQLADQLVSALAEPLVAGDAVVTGSVSVGVATTADATDAGELLQRADLALYVAKEAGKRRWSRYQSELHSAIVDRLELRAALAEAVERMSFSLEYQPIVDMRRGTVVGFEALARWSHPARGVIPPEQFIALAEETGLIEPIGDWVLREAVGAAAGWHRPGVAALPYVSVNVSAHQLRSAAFVKKVRAALDAADLPPTAVMLEITESLLLRDEEPVWSELTELRGLGLRVAIDDFGTGFSSLSYLQRMPADVLKIDRSFVETVAASRRQRLLVEGIVRLAGTLGLEVISEGVETEEVRLLLTDIGCVAGQGFLFSRPLTAGDVAEWVATGRHIALPPYPSD